MYFVIIGADGRTLTMHDGAAILFETEDAARAWLSEGEHIEPAPDDVAGVLPINTGRRAAATDGGTDA